MTTQIKRTLLCLTLVLAGCVASGPLGYKDLNPVPGQGALYVYRVSKFAAAGITADVVVDGKVVGSIPNGSYVASVVPSGKHTVEVKFSAINKIWYRNCKRELEIQDGHSTFLNFDIELTGLTVAPVSSTSWSTGLSEVPQEDAKQMIAKLRISDNQ